MSQITDFFQQLRRLHREAQDEGLELILCQTPTRAFKARAIQDVVREGNRLKVLVSFMGLFGGMGALPDYFTDEILTDPEEHSALRDFLDIFNHRVLEGLFLIWRKYQIFLEKGVDAQNSINQDFDRFLCSLAGISGEEKDRSLHMRCLMRHHFALFHRRERTLLGLSQLLKNFFSAYTFHFQEHKPRYIRIPSEQRAKMPPAGRVVLGAQGNFLVGSRMEDINGKFDLTVADLDYESYMRFLPGGDLATVLHEIVHAFTEDRWECGLVLELKASEVPRLQLGDRILSANCWLLSRPSDTPVQVDLGRLKA